MTYLVSLTKYIPVTESARAVRPPPDPNAVANQLHSAAIHLLRRVRRTDEATGLTPARLSLLSVLVFGGPGTISELAAQEQVAVPTMSRLVAALAATGLVQRAADPADGRLVFVAATKEGARLMLRARRDRVEYLARHISRLASPDVELLGRAAELMERAFQ